MKSKASSFLGLTLLALAVGFFAGTALAVWIVDTHADDTVSESAAAVQEAESRPTKEENERLKFINDMAQEFRMSPKIVAIVDKYSRQYVDAAAPEWRLIQTPEFMTHLMLSIIYTESKGDPDAVGDSGRARGLTQIWVTTAQQYGEASPQELLDPETNVRLSFEHFHYLLQRYRGNVAMTLYGWNRGQGTVDRLLRYGESPTNGYGRRVYRASLAAGADGLTAGD